MGLFSFFKKKELEFLAENVDLNLIRTDMHAHFLPGIDDGSKSMEDSLNMIREMQKLGYTKLVCTPHVMYGYYQNSTEKILLAYEQLKQELKNNSINIELKVSAEYNFDEELIHRLENNDILTFGNSTYQYLLFECSYFNEPVGLNELITQIFAKGYLPVLAHPERYPYFAHNTSKYDELKQKGVLFQLNLNSLSGIYSDGAKQIAKWLLEKDYIDFIGSDAHKIEHVLALNKALKHPLIHQLCSSGRLMNVSVE